MEVDVGGNLPYEEVAAAASIAKMGRPPRAPVAKVCHPLVDQP
jgi:hypothetical protein